METNGVVAVGVFVDPLSRVFAVVDAHDIVVVAPGSCQHVIVCLLLNWVRRNWRFLLARGSSVYGGFFFDPSWFIGLVALSWPWCCADTVVDVMVAQHCLQRQRFCC